MNKEITEKKFNLTIIMRFIKYFIILFLLFSNLVAADAQRTANSKDKNTAKYQGTISGEWSGQIMSQQVDGTLSLTIAANGTVSGTFSGFKSGTIAGTVSSSGELHTSDSSGINFSGHLSIADRRLSGNGTWEGFGGTGSWKSK
jgi:hypothetical protein